MIIFLKVYELVKQIPEGKVTTYGLIAEKLKISPRVVGWALHANRDRVCPCHRVVDRTGRLAPNFSAPGGRALGSAGWREQKRRLEAEGIKFKEETRVDLEKYQWSW